MNIAVEEEHLIHGCELTDRFVSDEKSVKALTEQIEVNVKIITADGAYDKNHVYDLLQNNFANVDVVIQPDSDAVYSKNNY